MLRQNRIAYVATVHDKLSNLLVGRNGYSVALALSQIESFQELSQ